LTPAQARLSISSGWNYRMLVERLTEEWLPEMDLGLPLADQRLQQAPSEAGVQHVSHFLYFPVEAVARQVQQRLRQRGGFTIDVRPAAQGAHWLVLVSDRSTSNESVDQTRLELESLAAQFKGEYDGWEIELEPA
jgi:hypothetical protein